MINRMIASVLPMMPKSLVWFFSRNYIAGPTLDDAVRVSKELNAGGVKTTVDLLGEFISDFEDAEKNMDRYLEIIERFESEKITGNYSLKPTMFGLLLDKDKCYELIKQIVKKASEHGNFVRIDMEDSRCVGLELELFRKLKQKFPENTGIVLQAYLKRTGDDIKNLLDLNTEENPLNIRLCKGIYNEPAEIAYKKYRKINHNFLKLLEFIFENKIYPGIATHDSALVKGAYKLIKKYTVPQNMYEFQMLFGVTPDLRQSVSDRGHNMRVYVPFGEHWFGYSSRRLKENPAMVSHFLKAIVYKG